MIWAGDRPTKSMYQSTDCTQITFPSTPRKKIMHKARRRVVKSEETSQCDIHFIRENPAAFDAGARGVSDASSGLLKIDGDRRAAILAAETAQAEQNKASKEVGAAKGRGDEAEFERLRALVREKAEVAEMNARAKELMRH